MYFYCTLLPLLLDEFNDWCSPSQLFEAMDINWEGSGIDIFKKSDCSFLK
jgi:hypothetical protein